MSRYTYADPMDNHYMLEPETLPEVELELDPKPELRMQLQLGLQRT